MIYEGFRLRSTEVDRGRPKSRVFGALFGRPDGFGSSDFAQNVDLFMLYRSILVSGADSKQKMECWQRKGRILRTGVA